MRPIQHGLKPILHWTCSPLACLQIDVIDSAYGSHAKAHSELCSAGEAPLGAWAPCLFLSL